MANDIAIFSSNSVLYTSEGQKLLHVSTFQYFLTGLQQTNVSWKNFQGNWEKNGSCGEENSIEKQFELKKNYNTKITVTQH